MPELRKDPVIGRWVIIAPERAMRPDQFKRPPTFLQSNKPCPFCEGNEAQTPPEIRALRSNGSANAPGWRMRVVPNKFPALRIEGGLEKRGEGIYDMMNGIGAHEVIVESPKHLRSITELSEQDVQDLMWLYKERITDLMRDARMKYVLVFKNVGESAGASLEHTHSQIIATPIVPIRAQSEINHCKQYYDFRGRCIICDMIKQEISAGTRLVINSENFIVLEPFAPRFPFETHLLPKSHQSHYEHLDDKFLPELARVLRATLARIEKVADMPPYNYLLHTTPMKDPECEHYHWHFEIFPRLTRVAGFEWGTGFYINPMPPEDAARYLREVKL